MSRLLWTQKQHVGPQARVGHALAYDSERRRTVLFGGDSLQGQLFGDTWEWDGESWTQVNDIGPSPRSEHALTYDARRHRVVLFGGTDGNVALADSWEWDGEDWTQMANSGPSARTGHAMVFDSSRNRVMLFGGDAAGTLQNDTWEWDGEEWVQVEDSGPAPRRDHAMAFDRARNRAVLFGGISSGQAFGDTWERDGAVWTQTSAFGPPTGLAITMIWNERRNLIFGGVSALTGSPILFANTWEWNGRHWTIRQDMGPGARWNHAMVFDSARQRGVLFGGTASAPGAASPTPLGDTWEQFERGAATVGGTSTLQSVTAAPPQPLEGENFTIQFTLTGPTAEALTVNFAVNDTAGTQLAANTVTIPAPLDHGEVSFPAAFFPGTYTVRATLGEVTRTTDFEVVVHNSLTLQSLQANPTTVGSGQSFTLTVNINGVAPATGLTPPMRVTNPDGTISPFGIPIPPGTSTGQLTINTSDLGGVQGTLTFTATLGGQTSMASVTIT